MDNTKYFSLKHEVCQVFVQAVSGDVALCYDDYKEPLDEGNDNKKITSVTVTSGLAEDRVEDGRKLDGNLYYDIFGSGTTLYVTDEVVKPVVSVYPAASRAHLEAKSFLVCVASATFPPWVKFSWKIQKEDGHMDEVPRDVGEQLEIRESGRAASILVIHRHESSAYKCSVQHMGSRVEAQIKQEVPAPAASCPPEREPAPEQADLFFQSQCRVKLLCLLYTVLIAKSLVYCCGLSLLMMLRNKGPSTNCTHAD